VERKATNFGVSPHTRVASACAASRRSHFARSATFQIPLIDRTSSSDEDFAVSTSTSPSQTPAAPSPSKRLDVFQRKCSVLEVVSDAKLLKAVAQMKILGLPGQVNGTLETSFRASAQSFSEVEPASTADLQFCCESLDNVSRSFAAVIRQLPVSLAVPTCVFYLVLRALDTVEDEMDLHKFRIASTEALRGSPAAEAALGKDSVMFKTGSILNFHHLLFESPSGRSNESFAWQTLQALNDAEVGAGSDQTLLKSFDSVVRVLQDHCTPDQQKIIVDMTRRMASGMAEYVQKDLGSDGTASTADYNKYCHIVAGLVGEGLSQLWGTAPDSGLTKASLQAVNHGSGLGCLASDMGLFLQKANIVRDYTEDQVDERAFWPQDIWMKFSSTGHLSAFRDGDANGAAVACLNAMINDALILAPRCFEYLQHLSSGDSRILRFCAIPQVMALCTLAECYGNENVFRGIVKAPRTQTARVCCEVGDMMGVLSWFEEVCTEIESKASQWEMDSSFDSSRDTAIVSETRSRLRKIRSAVKKITNVRVEDKNSSTDPWEDDDIPENWPCGPHSSWVEQHSQLV
jgi:farnesyl-diphosphate farnesyltransferase